MSNGDRIKVIDKVSGVESFVPAADFDPVVHELVEGQVATVAPLGGDEFAAGQLVTERSIAGGELFEQLSPEARGALTAEQVEEATFDTTTNIAEQAARGLASGLTLGVSELALRSTDPFERERARRERAAAPTAFAVGQGVGAVAPAVFSGGTGFLGAAARLTPTGRLAAATGRFASGSKGLARAARATLGGAAEGAFDALGATIANEALQEDPNFSADALAANLGTGALLGGIAGGVVDLAALGAVRFGRRGAALETALDPTAFRALDAPSVVGGLPPTAPVGALPESAFAAPRGQTLTVIEQQVRDVAGGGFKTIEIPVLEFSSVVSKKASRNVGRSFSELAIHVDDNAARAFTATTDELANVRSQFDRLGVDAATAQPLTDALDTVALNYQRASNDASEWVTQVSGEIGDLSKATPSQIGKALPDALEDDGILKLARLDDAEDQWRAASAEVQDALSGAINDANAAQIAGGAPSGLGERIAGITQSIRGRLSGGGLATAVGTVEVARDLGVDIPLPSVRDIPGIGGAISLYTKFKAGANAARRVGVLPSTATTRSASRVNTTRERIRNAVSGAARRVAVAAAKPSVRAFTRRTGSAVAREVSAMRSRDPAEVHAQVQAQVEGPPELAAAAANAAVRAHQYMLENGPLNPLKGTSMEATWVPTTQQQHEWQLRKTAINKPEQTIRASMSGGLRDIEVDAIRAVYPALYEFTQGQLVEQRNALRKKLPASTLQSLGRMYQVPLTIQQEPGYLAATLSIFVPREPDQPAGAPPALPRAINASTSSLGTLDQARPARGA